MSSNRDNIIRQQVAFQGHIPPFEISTDTRRYTAVCRCGTEFIIRVASESKYIVFN